MAKNTKFETVEDMVKYVVANPYYADSRWNLRDWDYGRSYGKPGNVTWTLEEPGAGYHKTTIDLSPELGEKLATIWKEGPAYRGASYTKRVGRLTIPGMLKRLGETDLGSKISEAKIREEHKAAVNSRNYARRQVRELAKQLLEVVNKNPDMIWPADLNMLAKLEDEKE